MSASVVGVRGIEVQFDSVSCTAPLQFFGQPPHGFGVALSTVDVDGERIDGLTSVRGSDSAQGGLQESGLADVPVALRCSVDGNSAAVKSVADASRVAHADCDGCFLGCFCFHGFVNRAAISALCCSRGRAGTSSARRNSCPLLDLIIDPFRTTNLFGTVKEVNDVACAVEVGLGEHETASVWSVIAARSSSDTLDLDAF